MSVFIYANPGQNMIITLQTIDSTGMRANPSSAPQITSIYDPSLASQTGFPVSMNQLETGFWSYIFEIPDGLSALGTYTISASWLHPTTGVQQYEVFSVHVVQPFGIVSVQAS